MKFYADGFRSEGAFSDPEYRERYNRVAALLVTLAKSQELVIDVGCGVGFWSTLMAKHEPVWLVWINCQGFFKSVGGELNG